MSDKRLNRSGVWSIRSLVDPTERSNAAHFSDILPGRAIYDFMGSPRGYPAAFCENPLTTNPPSTRRFIRQMSAGGPLVSFQSGTVALNPTNQELDFDRANRSPSALPAIDLLVRTAPDIIRGNTYNGANQESVSANLADYGTPVSGGDSPFTIEYIRPAFKHRGPRYTIVQTNGVRVLHQAHVFSYVPPIRVKSAGLDGFLVSMSYPIMSWDGQYYEPGIYYYSMADFLQAPSIGHPETVKTYPQSNSTILTSFAPMTRKLYSYPTTGSISAGLVSAVSPSYLCAVRDDVWVVEGLNNIAAQRVSKLSLKTGNHTTFQPEIPFTGGQVAASDGVTQTVNGVALHELQFCGQAFVGRGLEYFAGYKGGPDYLLFPTSTYTVFTLFGIEIATGKAFELARLDAQDTPRNPDFEVLPSGARFNMDPNELPGWQFRYFGTRPGNGNPVYSSTYQHYAENLIPGSILPGPGLRPLRRWYFEPDEGAQGPFVYVKDLCAPPPPPPPPVLGSPDPVVEPVPEEVIVLVEPPLEVVPVTVLEPAPVETDPPVEVAPPDPVVDVTVSPIVIPEMPADFVPVEIPPPDVAPTPIVDEGPTTPVEAEPMPDILPGDPTPPRAPRAPPQIPGEPPPPEPEGVPTMANRDLPSANKKFIPYGGKWTSKTFNDDKHIMFGVNGRLRGLIVTPNASNTAVVISAPGAFLVRGITCWVQTAPGSIAVPSLTPPLCVTADTVDADESNPFVFAVEEYNPVLLANKAIIATTDSTGFIWTPTLGLGIDEVLKIAESKQLSDDELRVLTSQDGNIDPADTQHTHRGLMRDRKAFETIFNFDFDKVPPVPLGREPQNADEYHTHENLPTDREIEVLTSRGGVTSADEQHTHDNLPSNEAFSAVFGGPAEDATSFHTHEGLTRAHGNVANPRATIWYVPQNVGNGFALINATESQFTGSVILILGSSGGPSIDRVVGIKYKEYARFYYDTVTAAIGGNPSVGTPAVEVIEEFVDGAPGGVVDPVPFNEEFVWRGIKFQVNTPSVGVVPFTGPTVNDATGDFFTYHAVIATTTPTSGDGLPNCTPQGLLAAGANTRQVKMHERLLSYAALRLVPVLDPRFPEGGYLTMAYI